MIQRLIITLATIAATLTAMAETSSTATWQFTVRGAGNVYTTTDNTNFNSVTNGADFSGAANTYYKLLSTPHYESVMPFADNSQYVTVTTNTSSTTSWVGGEATIYSYTAGETDDEGNTTVSNTQQKNKWTGYYPADADYCIADDNGTLVDASGNHYTALTKGDNGTLAQYINIVTTTTTTYKTTSGTTLYTSPDNGTTYEHFCNGNTEFTPDPNETYYRMYTTQSYVLHDNDLPSDGSETLTQHFDHLGYIKTTKIKEIDDIATWDGTVPDGTLGIKIKGGTLDADAVTKLKALTGIEHIVMDGCSDPGHLAIEMFDDADFGSKTSVTEIVLPPDYAQAAIDKTKFPVADLPNLACVSSADCKKTTVAADGTVSTETTAKAEHLSAYVIKAGSFFSSNATKTHLPEIWDDNNKLVAKNIIAVGNININDIHGVDAQGHTASNMVGSGVETLDLSGATYIPYDGEDTSNAFFADQQNNCVLKRLLLPEGITAICDEAYDKCTSLEYVRLPQSLLSVGDRAFQGCTNLTQVDCAPGAHLKDIGSYCFQGCDLEQLRFPNELETIGDHAFVADQGKSHYSVVTFPATIRSIGANAFENVWIKDVYFLGLTAPTLGDGCFKDGQYYGNGVVKEEDVRVLAPDGKYVMLDKDSDGVPETYAKPKDLTGQTVNNVEYPDCSGYGSGSDATAIANAAAKGFKFVGKSDLYKQSDNINSNYTTVLHLNPGLVDTEGLTDGEKAARQIELEKFTDVTRHYAMTDWRVGDGRKWPTQEQLKHAFNVANANPPTQLFDGSAVPDYVKPYMNLHKFALVCFDVKRTTTEEEDLTKFREGYWWSFCVPFNMTKKQVVDVFGSETRVCKLSDITRELNDATNEIELEIFFCDEKCLTVIDGTRWEPGENATVIEANHPYMIHPQTGSVKPDDWVYGKFKDYVVSPDGPQTESFTTTCKHVGEPHKRTYQFYGNFADKANDPNADGVYEDVHFPQYSYFMYYHNVGEDNEYHELAVCPWTDLKHAPNSCCLSLLEKAERDTEWSEIFNGGSASSRRKMGQAFGAGGDEKNATTGIEHVRVVCGQDLRETVADYYTLDGRRLATPPTRKGVYIHGGRKEVVR